MIKFPIGVDGADSFRYLWVLNYTDQTVSCIDQSSNTVIATITLTAAKALRSIFYRPVSKSVYVVTTNWFDRIDADPSSGTFNTVVGSGALTSNANMPSCSYIPFLDTIGYVSLLNAGMLEFDSSHNILGANTTNANVLFRKNFPYVKIGRNYSVEPPMPGAISPMHFTDNGYMLSHGQNVSDIYKMDELGGNKYTFKDFSIREGVARLGYANIIGDYTTGHRSTAFYIIDLETKAVVFSFGVSASDRVSHKYCAKDQKIFCYQRINTNVILSVIDWKTKTDLGDIDRTSYKATNEGCTRMGLYSPYNGFFYVLGGNTAGSGTVDKVHYYDPSQVLASMYQASITVGNSATAPVDYLETAMCMNGIERYGFTDKAY